MRWIAKAVVQGALSAIPRGDALNYLLQRHVTHGLPKSEAVFDMHVEEARRHYDAVRRHYDPEHAVLYEFGAGWDLIGPLVLARLGVRQQILVDIRANLRLELVNDTLARLGAEPVASIGELEGRFGIRYVAPCAIDMKDHYSYFDGRLDAYHFLSVRGRAWRLVNPPLHHQNRLRLPDYRRLFRDAGLTIVDEDVRRPAAELRRRLESLDLAPRFRGYTLDDLSALEVRLVAQVTGYPGLDGDSASPSEGEARSPRGQSP